MNPSASCSSTENSAENSPSFNSDNRTSMTYPLYPTLLFMTATSSASIIALRDSGDSKQRRQPQDAQFTVAPPQHRLSLRTGAQRHVDFARLSSFLAVERRRPRSSCVEALVSGA